MPAERISPAPEPLVVEVGLGQRRYDIQIGTALLAKAGEAIAARFGRRRLIVLSDSTVAALYAKPLCRSLETAGHAVASLVIPPGEDSKDLRCLPQHLEALLELSPDRRSMLVALGGGVVGDLTGFAAAILLRGIDFVQIPTTLLAQIDSAVGGKTGVNAPQGKNLVGAFHQPRLVLADLDTLDTLAPRELRAGYAEMVKYGVLGDARFFAHLERSGAAILAGEVALRADAIAHCCRMKAAIVAEDEREAGRRALLNLGHTFGHALEAATGFGAGLLHGEGVAVGMVLAARLSAQLGLCAVGDADRLAVHLKAAGLPVAIRDVAGLPLAARDLMASMQRDKKTVDGKIAFVLIDGIGAARSVAGVPAEDVERVLKESGAI